MGVAFRRVEKQIADASARDMLVLRSHIGEDDARGGLRSRPFESSLPEIGFSEIRETKEPQDCFGNSCEDAKPGAESCGFDLGKKVS